MLINIKQLIQILRLAAYTYLAEQRTCYYHICLPLIEYD